MLTWSALGDVQRNSTGLVINVRGTFATAGTFKLVTVTGSYGDVYGEGFSFNFCRTVNVFQPPTASRLQSFAGAAKDAKIRLDWETGTELDIIGFNVWRSEKRGGDYSMVNGKLIPAKNVGQVGGAAYTFRDKTTQAGKTYFYKIEIVSATQTSEWSNIRRVRVP